MRYVVERLADDGKWYAWGVYDDLDRATKACVWLQEMGQYARTRSEY
jgi:hypothetical protein